jgi:LuxR family transcriptional regulator, maltose regulon positive regulatory protein
VPPENKTQRAAVLELLVRVQSALGERAGAAASLNDLQEISTTVATHPLRASVNFSEGVVAAADGDHETARQSFEDAVNLFQRIGAPYETARARTELASVLWAVGRSHAAEKMARAALESFQELGAAREADRAAALLRRLNTPERTRETFSGLTHRELEILRLLAQGKSNQEIATGLVLSEHTIHRHVANVLGKLGVSSRAAAVAQAARHDLL